MKKATTLILALVLGLFAAQTAWAANAVNISQVYGGGGSTTTGTYIYDYVELFNNSGAAVTIGGWAIMYGSAGGSSFGSTTASAALIPSGATIPKCSYYLIQVGSAGTVGAPFPVTPDLISSGPSMSLSSGKVALISNQTIPGPACVGNTTGGSFVDVVGYGTGNCYETTAAAVLSNSTVAVRKLGGGQDTDVNSADFVIQGTNITTMHNSSMYGNPDCMPTLTRSGTWGKIKVLYR